MTLNYVIVPYAAVFVIYFAGRFYGPKGPDVLASDKLSTVLQ